MSDKEQIQCQLARLGLRTAHPNEAGWYVTVEIYTFPGRETRKVWATDSVITGGARRQASGNGIPARAALWRTR